MLGEMKSRRLMGTDLVLQVNVAVELVSGFEYAWCICGVVRKVSTHAP